MQNPVPFCIFWKEVLFFFSEAKSIGEGFYISNLQYKYICKYQTPHRTACCAHYIVHCVQYTLQRYTYVLQYYDPYYIILLKVHNHEIIFNFFLPKSNPYKPFVNFRKKFHFFSFDFRQNFDVRTFPWWLSIRGTKFLLRDIQKNFFSSKSSLWSYQIRS